MARSRFIRAGRPTLVRRAALVATGLLALGLTSCEYGEATGVSELTDISATLHGAVHSTDPLPEFWFEYDEEPAVVDGALTFASSTTVGHWACCGPMTTASRTVTGLQPDTTYWYRFCIRTDTGRGLCGAAESFTTMPDDRDVVEGTLATPMIPELGYVAAVSVSVRAEPDGSNPVGRASRLPGSAFFRYPDSGPVTCLRVEGNRAAIGFVATYPELDPELVVPDATFVMFVEDNGPTGDRYSVVAVDDTPTDCPDPTDAVITTGGTEGDLTVVDN